MTDIERKALELVNEGAVRHRDDLRECKRDEFREALCRAIERHDAFRQEVSDAVEAFLHNRRFCGGGISQFIIPKTDPLVEAMAECGVDPFESWADELRAALAKRGLEIREKA